MVQYFTILFYNYYSYLIINNKVIMNRSLFVMLFSQYDEPDV